jgi:hypothetical protein
LNRIYPLKYYVGAAWVAGVLLSVGSLLSFGVLANSVLTTLNRHQKEKTTQHIPKLVDEDFRGIFKLPLLDKRHTIRNVMLYSLGLGTLAGFGAWITIFTKNWMSFGTFLVFITIFHLMEYVTTVMFKKGSLNAFLLNHSQAYHLALLAALLESVVGCLFFPTLKNNVSVYVFGKDELIDRFNHCHNVTNTSLNSNDYCRIQF